MSSGFKQRTVFNKTKQTSLSSAIYVFVHVTTCWCYF